MKKISVIFSVLAIVLAIAGASATALQPKTQVEAYRTVSSDPDSCEPADVICEGGPELCEKIVDGAGLQEIWNLEETGCHFRLTME